MNRKQILSASNTNQYRLHSDQSGFENLCLGGDWTNNGINFGCLEAAVTSAAMATETIVTKFAAATKQTGV
jgi:hypothetical protein